MKIQASIVGIGEVLMDVFSDGTATVGGAPFNVAFQAHQLLQAFDRGRGDIVSAVGNDDWGRHILSAIRENGMSEEHVALNAHFPTGTAAVNVHQGEAGFEIAPDAAWDHLDADAALDQLARHTAAVAFGSLAQRRPEAGKIIREFAGKVNGHRLYDVNLRQNTTNGVRGYNASIVHESALVATIVKANSAELEEIGQMLGFPADDATGEQRIWNQMEQLRNRYALFAVAVTRGAKGAMILTSETTVRLSDSTLPADQIHPVGAGDAFSAGLLYGLTQHLSIGSSGRLADRLASWVTGYTSATPRLSAEIRAELQAIERSDTDAS